MSRIICLFPLLISQMAFAELQSLDNQSLAEVSGQDGVGLSMEYRLNADASGTSKCGGAIPLIECRIALSFNNRGSAASNNQEWLILKGVSGRVLIPYVALDAGTVTYSNDSNVSTTIPAAVFGADPNSPLRIQKFVISNMAVETDTSSVRGYMAAAEDGFMGLRIDDSNSISTATTPFLGVQLTGTVKMFPCNADHKMC